MTVHILTCGVSILDGLGRRRGDPGGAADPGELLDKASAWGGRVRTSNDTAAVALFTELHSAIDDARLGEWKTGVAAETNSLAARTDFDQALTDGHTVVLLASDTDTGLTSAMIGAARISASVDGTINYERIRYATTPVPVVQPRLEFATWPYQFNAASVTVVRVRGLDPRIPGGLDAAAAGLGQALRAAYDSASGAPVEIHLTGGLKATLLHTLLMAEMLHSLNKKIDVSAWYLYDDTTENPDAVKIGLRRFNPAHLRVMREELRTVARGDGNMTDRLFEELAWAGEGEEARLNDFGTAFLAVLGEEEDPPDNDGCVL